MARTSLDGSLVTALVMAVLAGVAGVAGSYAVTGYTPAFLAAPITSFLTGVMPDAVLRFAIVTLTDIGRRFGIEHLGQRANLLLALVLGTALLAVLSLAALAVGQRYDSAVAPVGLAGGFVWVATALVTGAPVPALAAGVASAVVVAVAVLAATMGDPTTAVSSERREVIGGFASALGIGVLGYVLGSRGGGGRTAATASTEGTSETVQQYLSEAENRSLDIEGLEGLVSGEDFYEVDIKNVNPTVDASDWSLTITGAVENEIEYTYDDITSMERELRFATLRCVSDPLNGKKMDNDLWTGVPTPRLLEEANPQGEFVMLRSTDGYYEELELDSLRDGFLAYGKNGGPLPRNHGHPARALVAGHWGEVSVKWIDEIEVLDGPQKGYWEKKGWHGTGPVNTVAKLHAVNRLDDGRIRVGGHTYAGTRGIERVEVSTDGGETWNAAILSEPLPPGTSRSQGATAAESTWRQWAYTYEPPSGEHQVVVRAVDGNGDLQPRDNSGSPYPNGAAGWVSRTISE